MPIKNYTTEVSEDRTIGEIMSLLARKGANSVRVNYDPTGVAEAILFGLTIHGVPILFRLPCNVEGVKKCLATESKPKNPGGEYYKRQRDPQGRARRVAWRIIKDWVDAQLALIEAEQATMAQAFLPYALSDERAQRTVFDDFLLSVSKQKQLPPARAAHE